MIDSDGVEGETREKGGSGVERPLGRPGLRWENIKLGLQRNRASRCNCPCA
jgi:hypothetical protein